MRKIVIATSNLGKAEEFKQMLSPKGFQVLTLIDFPDAEDVEETGTTFEENALLKARTLSAKLNIPVLADDSGVIVDALDGRPGLYSARYAGEPRDDVKNYEKVLDELGDLPLEKRTARYYCVIAFVAPDITEMTTDGTVEGKILFAPEGTSGFGYDPVFWVNALGKTYGESSALEKNSASHRSRALEKMVVRLENLANEKGIEIWEY